MKRKRKVYTAKEMREMAENIVRVDVMDGLTCRVHCYPQEQVVRAMLRQAADAMDREEKREKKYEYGVMFTYEGGLDSWGNSMTLEVVSVKHLSTLEGAKCYAQRKPNFDSKIIRREVGEWEEVE